jgi:hypothetical protein
LVNGSTAFIDLNPIRGWLQSESGIHTLKRLSSVLYRYVNGVNRG